MRNNTIKQYLLIGLILFLALTVGMHLFTFFPGLLGAVTFYVLLRQPYFKLTVIHQWKKAPTALLFIFSAIIVFVLPIVGILQILIPKFNALIENKDRLTNTINNLATRLLAISPQFRINQQQLMNIAEKITGEVPGILGATANMLTNALLAFFILYFMLVDGRKMEQSIQKYIPLQPENIDNIWEATRTMVVSNAVGIPILAASQAAVAILGYLIFGIDEYILWGILTGVASLVPLIGCMIIWGPLVVYLFSTGHTGAAIGLSIYSFVITGGIDNVLRFTILKRLGDVHPIVTALGIIVGIPIFGFMGFIFGPLLISYLLLLIKVYRAEFAPNFGNTGPQ